VTAPLLLIAAAGRRLSASDRGGLARRSSRGGGYGVTAGAGSGASLARMLLSRLARDARK
jgi:hypothetical protein